jgi:hypothetical protein
VGGRLVYSTCSFNPIENEAVICALLDWACDAVQVESVTSRLHKLRLSSGLSTWRVADAGMQWHDDAASGVGVLPTMFPPDPTNSLVCEQLKRCCRLLPHHNDTGGFFVAVLTKCAALPSDKLASDARPPTHVRPASTAAAPYSLADESGLSCSHEPDGADTPGLDHIRDDTDDGIADADAASTAGTAHANRARLGRSEPPLPWKFQSLPPRTEAALAQFYGLVPPNRTRECSTSCIGAGAELVLQLRWGSDKSVYAVSARGAAALSAVSGLRAMHAGVRVLDRNPHKDVPSCDFRMTQDGVASFGLCVTQRILPIGDADMRALITAGAAGISPRELSAAVQESLRSVELGSVLLVVQQVPTVAWRGLSRLQLHVDPQGLESLREQFVCETLIPPAPVCDAFAEKDAPESIA